MKTKILLLALTALLTQNVSAQVFDDKRKGFILGLGAGFHSSTISDTFNGNNVGVSQKLDSPHPLKLVTE